jgi:ribosomal protein S8
MSTVTDPIADFLTRVRNGTHAQQIEVFVPYSKIKAEIARILKDEGYISDYSIDTSAAHPRITARARLQACDGLAGRDCAATSVRMRSREFLVGWVWRFSLHRVAFCRGAKRRSKRSVANC